jgi:hypothetical protein
MTTRNAIKASRRKVRDGVVCRYSCQMCWAMSRGVDLEVRVVVVFVEETVDEEVVVVVVVGLGGEVDGGGGVGLLLVLGWEGLLVPAEEDCLEGREGVEDEDVEESFRAMVLAGPFSLWVV